MTGITDAMQSARIAFAALTAPTETLTTLMAAVVTNAKSYLQVGHQIRVGDNALFLNTMMPQYVAGTPFAAATLVPEEVKILAPDGVTVIDKYPDASNYDKILEAAPAATEDQKNDLKTKLETYGTDADITAADTGQVRRTKKAAVNHKNNISAFKDAIDVMEPDITACKPAKKKKRGLFSLSDVYRLEVRRQNQHHLRKIDVGIISPEVNVVPLVALRAMVN